MPITHRTKTLKPAVGAPEAKATGLGDRASTRSHRKTAVGGPSPKQQMATAKGGSAKGSRESSEGVQSPSSVSVKAFRKEIVAAKTLRGGGTDGKVKTLRGGGAASKVDNVDAKATTVRRSGEGISRIGNECFYD